MHVATIKYADIANGPGVRTSLFVSGCRHHCPGCFNEIAWNFSFGEPFGPELANNIIESVRPSYIAGLTVLGGEPMEPENQEGLTPFLEQFRLELPDKSIWMYTGDVYENLTNGGSRETPYTARILQLVDVLVDGPFVQRLHDVSLRFRGSSNQRLIDLRKTQLAGEVVLWQDEKIYSEHADAAQLRKST